jgi:hypothetical protein
MEEMFPDSYGGGNHLRKCFGGESDVERLFKAIWSFGPRRLS